MITAKIVESQPRLTQRRISLRQLVEITGVMESDGYMVYTLFDDSGLACYQGVFEPNGNTLIADIEAQVNASRLNAEITDDEANSLLAAIQSDLQQTSANVTGGAAPPVTDSDRVSRMSRLYELSKQKKVRYIFYSLLLAVVLVPLVIECWALVPKKPTYEKLMAQENYQQAAQYYPSKKRDIENFLFEKRKINQLARFNKSYPTANGQYDLAFYQSKWTKLLAIKNANMTKVRKAQQVVAYLKLHRPEDAYRLNLELNNQKLAQTIALEFIRGGEIERAVAINQKLKNPKLSDLINAGKSYQQVIEKYQKEVNDASLSSEQHQQAADNLAVWQHNLKTIGE